MRHALILLLLGLLVAPSAQAWRCGTSVVTSGDRAYQVQEACGKPDFVDRHAEVFVAGVGFLGEIEQWYYNRGPRQLIRILRFHNGELQRIATGGYGFTEVAEGNCSPREIQRGMSKFELLRRCGEPDYRDTRWTSHSPGMPGLVDDWVYDFGPTRFPREVRIVDGRVVDVELGER